MNRLTGTRAAAQSGNTSNTVAGPSTDGPLPEELVEDREDLPALDAAPHLGRVGGGVRGGLWQHA